MPKLLTCNAINIADPTFVLEAVNGNFYLTRTELFFVFMTIMGIENNLIYPRVVGTSIGLPSMWVLVAVGVGGELMGFAGMFLMIPVTSVVYTLLAEVTNKKLADKTVDAEKLKCQPPDRIKRMRISKKKK